MEHKKEIKGYGGRLNILANDIGDLQYDSLALFLQALALKLQLDSTKDRLRGRKKLALFTHVASDKVGGSADLIMKAWKICEPHMKEK